jgi:two-component system, response regulator, stage 0 sporulation protein F
MKMAGIDGTEVLKKIKKEWPAVPVIMMTAYGELEKIEEVLALGAEKYFTKPFDIYEVRDTVNAIIAG